MKIIFTRHCESEANLLHELSNRGLKHPLTLSGRSQASLLADRLSGHKITRIFSSPLLRAIETSVIIANWLAVPYEIDEGLREYDLGMLEGRSDDEAWQGWQRIYDGWLKYQRFDERIDGGENYHDVRDRFVPFIEGIVARYRETGSNLLCVGHGALYAMMLPLVLVNIDRDFILRQNGFPYMESVVSEIRPTGLVCTDWGGVKLI